MKVTRRALRAWAPPPKLTVSQWADTHRILSPESSPHPGRWRTEKTEYLREPMDSISAPGVTKVVVMKSVQVGYTDGCLGNMIGFHIAEDAASIMVVMPTLELAEEWSKQRLALMIRDTPTLAALVDDPRSRDSNNAIRSK